MKRNQWISVKDKLPADFNERGYTKHYLVFIDNPFFHEAHLHVARFYKSPFGDQYNNWGGIEGSVHHGPDNGPNVTYWMELPQLPNPQTK